MLLTRNRSQYKLLIPTQHDRRYGHQIVYLQRHHDVYKHNFILIHFPICFFIIYESMKIHINPSKYLKVH